MSETSTTSLVSKASAVKQMSKASTTSLVTETSDIKFETEFCIFTDGSALGNSKESPAGYAMYIPCVKKLLSKGMFGTNNQAELNAIKFTLWYVKENIEYFKNKIKNGIYILTDSLYSMNCVLGKYKAKANINLIVICRQFYEDLKNMGYNVEFHHVAAHTGKKDFVSYCNNIVDMSAKKRAYELRG